MALLTGLQIPEKWASDSKTLLETLLSSPLLEKTLGQIYDGREIWETYAQSGNVKRLMDPMTPMEISEDAKEDVQTWVDSQDVDQIELDRIWKRELELLFASTDGTRDRVAGLALCLFKPVVRWWLQKYCEHVTMIGKVPPAFNGRRHGLDRVRAIQDWGEERIFGGELGLDGDTVFVLPPKPQASFKVSQRQLLNVYQDINTLPLRPPVSSRRHPRLEDDPNLMKYMP